MKFQSRKFTCGPAAICNALEVYGEYREEQTIGELSGTTPDGTGERGIRQVLTLLGFTPESRQDRDGVLAFAGIDSSLLSGNPVLLCVDSWEHWVVAVGRVGTKYILSDSANEHMILYLTQQQLAKRWKHTGSRYYSIHLKGRDSAVVFVHS